MSGISFVSTTTEEVEYRTNGGLHKGDTEQLIIVKETPTEAAIANPHKPVNTVGRNLYEQLQEQKAASEAAWKEKNGPLHKPPRSLDAEDAAFLDDVSRRQQEKELLERKLKDQDKLMYEMAMSQKLAAVSTTASAGRPKLADKASVKSGSESAPTLTSSLAEKMAPKPLIRPRVAATVMPLPVAPELEPPPAKKARVSPLVEYDSDASS
jgi:hypothetical protein